MKLEELKQGFIKADPRFGPVPFWWWSAEEVTSERVRWQLQKFRKGGLRNIGIINIAPTGPQYGSVSDRPAYFTEDWWDMFEVAVRECERLGMNLWFYDQIGFSGSNFPARMVSENPAYAGYVLRRFMELGEVPIEAEVLLKTDDFVYAAVRQGFNWLDSRATKLLLDKVHGEFEKRFPHDLGKTIVGSFQDELPPLPLWTAEIPQIYQERFNEDLLPLLPALFEDLPHAGEVRRRVYQLATELAEQSFFIPISEWHERHNMLISCDQAGPARKVDPHGAQRLYLDYFRTHRWYSSPGSDMDGEAKAHSSMVHLNGGKRVWLEAFHSSGWGGTLEETMHWLVPWFQAGVTLYSPHAVYFSTRGGWWEWAPPDTGWRQPYYEHYQVFADTVSRVCFLLSQGHHVADIGIHYPSYAATGFMSLNDGESSEHPMAIANRLPNENMKHIERVYKHLTGRWNRKEQSSQGPIRTAKRDFDVMDDSVIEKAVIKGHQLIVEEESFSALLLSGTTIMSEQAKRKLEAWIKNGGLVIGVEVPQVLQTIEGVYYVEQADEAVEIIDRKLPKRVEGKGASLQRQTDEADVFLLLPDEGHLLKMHYPAEPGQTLQTHTSYRLKSEGIPELWDPTNGKIERLAYKRVGEWIELNVPFTAWPAALIVCKKTDISAIKSKDQTKPLKQEMLHQRLESGKRTVLSQDKWKIRALSTLDNRYGDFDLHGTHTFMPIERRLVKVNQETTSNDGIRSDWHKSELDDSTWIKRLWSESAYWLASPGNEFNPSKAWPVVYSTTFGDMKFRTWAGRMGRIPRRFLNLGEVEQGEWVTAKTNVLADCEGDHWIRLESNAKIKGSINGSDIQFEGGPEEQTAWIKLKEGPNELVLKAKAIVKGLIRVGVEVNLEEKISLPKWIFSSSPNSQTRLVKDIVTDEQSNVEKVRLVFAARGRVALYVNGNKVTEHGDFNPYIRQGQEEVDVTAVWKEGTNRIEFQLPEGEGEVFADGLIEYFDGHSDSFCTGDDWKDEAGHQAQILHEAVLQFAETESLWITSRPHPLPNVGWLMPESIPDPKPLPFSPNPEKLGDPVWLRFPLPIGTKKLKIEALGETRIWINSEEVAVHKGISEFLPQPAGTIAAIRVEPNGPFSEADVLAAPIRFETASMEGQLGDWRTVLHLPHHSGAIDYLKIFKLDQSGPFILDLGHIRGTAEVWVDNTKAGIRVWRPYVYELGELKQGEHQLRIRVTNTLGTHYEIGRPSHVIGGEPLYWNENKGTGTPQQFAAGGLYGPVTLIESEINNLEGEG
ncbi:glycosyl hydrolase [Pullulanibacillus sp. KACC 23026]|uniref:glycosyl hydrolase n=1 Tax=Pullulanibacillus sp. KACC 23026 TaxID=3028315 RepID=UPI0023B0EF82|nr:glycosyl hydrolase [Pullulanibacillus sp. KACC 23026]WEG11746.1 glycosyl hydrolase [Pullulanibacillus sp. KACC 23026]